MKAEQHGPVEAEVSDSASRYRDASKISGSISQAFYRRQARQILSQLGNLAGCRVLDLGCGTGFLKPLFEAGFARYQGIDGDAKSIGIARQLYGTDGFIHGFFPQDLPTGEFDLIISLSCVDEMPDRALALSAIAERLDSDGRALLAVRNGAFPIHQIKRLLHRLSIKRTLVIDDLDYYQWISIIGQAGLKIDKIQAYRRPWFTGANVTGLKNAMYRSANWVLPTRWCYMLQFLLSKK